MKRLPSGGPHAACYVGGMRIDIIDDAAFVKINEALDRNEGVTLSAVELRTLYEFAKDHGFHRAHSDVLTLIEQLENVALTRSSAERAGTPAPDADEAGGKRG